jgi:ADP-heptose:LPS heptosyltransferase
MLTYRKKVFIDRAIGAPLAFLLNAAATLTGLILRRKHGLPHLPKTVVVAKIVGIGSIVHTGVLCRAIKTTFPATQVVYVTSASNRGLMSRMKYVDAVLTIDESSMVKMIVSTVSIVLKMWRIRPELYFDLELYSSWAAILATLSLARNRYGFFRKSAFYKLGLHSHLLYFNTARPIDEIYLRLANAAGADGKPDIAGILAIKHEDRDVANNIMENKGIMGKPYIMININASELMLERRWPLRKWELLLEQATDLWPDISFLLAGSPSEKSFVTSLAKSGALINRKNVINIAGQISLTGYFALIERATAMVTIDSGPMHVALSLGVPTISLWGPGHPEHYAASLHNHHIIYRQIYCSPCLYHADYAPCNGDNQCMKRIPVDLVLKEMSLLIKRSLPGRFDAEFHLVDTESFNVNNMLLGLVKRPEIIRQRMEQGE